ncbi:MAG: MFS transporter [Spirochaetales bacterium]|nr:MFS transporter [Spirochaetales bacterium]
MQKWKKNLYAVWLTQFFSLMGFGFGIPFIPFFIQELGVTDPHALKIWTGWLTSAPAVGMAVMAPVWGLLSDKLGKKIMLLRAMLGGFLALAGLGLSNSVYLVLVFRLLQGLLSGTVTSSAALVASGTPNKNLSYALGFLSSSTFVGYSLGPAVGGIVADIFGYRASFFIGSAILFAGLLLVIFIIEEPDTTKVEDPKVNKTSGGGKLSEIITPSLMIFLLLIFCMRISRTLVSPFLPLIVQDARGTIEGSSRITGILSGAIGLMSASAGLTLSRLGDKMDRLKLLSILLGIGTFVSLFINIFDNFILLFILLPLTYFFIGGIEPLLMSITSEKVEAKNRGLLFGIQTAVGSSAWFLSPILGSWAAVKFSTRSVFVFFTFFLLLTWGLSMFTKYKKAKKICI